MMVGELPEDPLMSKFTLFLFIDSGWYDVEFNLE